MSWDIMKYTIDDTNIYVSDGIITVQLCTVEPNTL